MQEQISLGGFHSDLQPSSIYSALPGAPSQPSRPWQVRAGQTSKQTLDPGPEALPLGSGPGAAGAQRKGLGVAVRAAAELAGASCDAFTGFCFPRNSLTESRPVFLNIYLLRPL